MMRSSILAAAAVSIVGVLADSHNNSSSIALASSPSISASTTSVDPSKPCKGWNVLVTPAVVSYPSDVVEYSSTLTATVIPHITEYADGSRHTSWTTVMVAPNATTTIPYSSPKNEPLVWTEYGYTLTYPNTYIAFSDVRGGPNILPPATSAPSVVFRPGATCAQNITSVSLQATSTFLFPLATADPAHTTAAASSLLAVLNDTPGVLSQFNGTNMKDCTLSIDGTRTVKLAPITAAAVTKVSVAVLQQTAQAVITRVSDTAPSDGKDKPADAQDAGAKDQASPAAAAAPTSVGLGDLIASALGMARPVADAPAPTNGVKIGSETYALAPAPNGAVAFGSYTLPAGAATSINGVPVAVPSKGAGAVVVVGGVTRPVPGAESTPGAKPGADKPGANRPGANRPGADKPEGKPISFGGQVFTPAAGAWKVGGQTLTPGGAVTLNGVAVSIPTGAAGAVVVGGKTGFLQGAAAGKTQAANADAPRVTAPPGPVTLGGKVYGPTVVGGKTVYVGGGKTLSPGGTVDIEGFKVSLADDGETVVVGLKTIVWKGEGSETGWVAAAQTSGPDGGKSGVAKAQEVGVNGGERVRVAGALLGMVGGVVVGFL